MEFLNTVSVGDVMKWLLGIVAVLSIFIQITPIKWNPISSLLNWIGSKLNESVRSQIEGLHKEINSVNEKVDNLELKVSEVKGDMNERLDASESKQAERAACDARVRILRFGGEVIRGIGHSEEEFNNVLHDMDEYDSYCLQHPEFPNNRTVAISNRIKQVYNKCIAENSFLT